MTVLATAESSIDILVTAEPTVTVQIMYTEI